MSNYLYPDEAEKEAKRQRIDRDIAEDVDRKIIRLQKEYDDAMSYLLDPEIHPLPERRYAISKQAVLAAIDLKEQGRLDGRSYEEAVERNRAEYAALHPESIAQSS